MNSIDKPQNKARMLAMRSLMKLYGVDAAILPQTDPHQSEYLADHWQVRRFFSGFTGSAGTLVITAEKTLLWTDSRYFIQAAQQLDGTDIILMKAGLPDTPSIEDYLISTLPSGSTIGIDGMLFSVKSVHNMLDVYSAHGLKLVTDFDVIDKVWLDRPSLPKDEIFIHEEKYAGEGVESKITKVLENVHAQQADTVLISPLDEIAWTLNIRCNDVRYNPVATAYLYISDKGSVLLIDPDKVNDEVKHTLNSQGVEIEPYTSIKEFVSKLPNDTKVLVDINDTSSTICNLLGSRVVEGTSPVAVAKACRNEVQIAGIRAAMERDGVAMVKAFMEMEDIMNRGEALTEIDVESLLKKYRSEQPLFFDESFGTIAGYAEHGAIVHYEATPESNVQIQPKGLLLIDSGAQYLDGTTDITRTISMGQPTEQEKHDFTLVLKGNIALDSMIFPVNTRGAQLDVEARKYMWREGINYLHGTGHGVGQFLNVHEGPQTIRMNDTPIPLMEGMVTSNEPGIYREGLHGVRCENLMLCVKAMSTDFGDFLKFETLTLFPFDTTLMETAIMTEQELQWVNDYHQEVYQRLSPYLSDTEKDWLKQKTQPIQK